MLVFPCLELVTSSSYYGFTAQATGPLHLLRPLLGVVFLKTSGFTRNMVERECRPNLPPSDLVEGRSGACLVSS